MGDARWPGIGWTESDQMVTGQHLSVEVQTGFKYGNSRIEARKRGIGEQMGWFTQKHSWGRTRQLPV